MKFIFISLLFVYTAAHATTAQDSYTIYSIDGVPKTLSGIMAPADSMINNNDQIAFEPEVPAEVKAQVESDLAAVAAITAPHQSPLHQKIYGPVSGPVYMNWFLARVGEFGYDQDDTSGAIAYNDSMFHPNHMMVTNYFVKGNLPQVARIMVLFHEARHSEGKSGYWAHAYCPNPFVDENGKEIRSILSGLPIAGKPACDRSVMGAYGASTVMITNLSRFCDTCNDKFKFDAALYGRDQVNRIINGGEHAALLKDANDTAP